MSMKVALIVDDSGLARMMIAKCLQMADRKKEYSVKEAGDGKVALEIIDQGQIDLVISDLNMPNLSGEELLKKIQMLENQKMPVILVSSKINDAKSQELIKIGAKAVLKKPLTPTHLMQTLEELAKEQ